MSLCRQIGIQVSNLNVSITNGGGHEALLGQNFLRHMDVEIRDDMLVLRAQRTGFVLGKKANRPKPACSSPISSLPRQFLICWRSEKFDEAFKLANRLWSNARHHVAGWCLCRRSGRARGRAAQQWQRLIALAQTGKVPVPILTQVWFNLGKLCQSNNQATDAASNVIGRRWKRIPE